MRELFESQDAGPSLFDAPPPESYEQARDFVRWCCSFGADFRNSPDITNLRYWAQKNNVKIKERDEREILDTARTMLLKKIEQGVRNAERTETPN
ncbi:MAG TPA: hypothetical protein VGK48_03770 [Terriglobia bacterium]|jgi:hypothetical protein